MNRRSFLQATLATGAATLIPSIAKSADSDFAIIGGRVIDPETGLDAIRNVGITGGRINTVTQKAIRARQQIDASGLVVAPGFIDPIAHGLDEENNRLQALDGVTTTLQLESGYADVAKWYADCEGKMALNYGCSAGHGHAREKAMGKDSEYGHPTDAQIAAMKVELDKQLMAGAIACGFGIEYEPGASHWEVIEMFRVAAKHGASCHVHTRYGTLLEPGSAVEGLQEIISAGAITGAPVHMLHVPSMGLKNTPKLLQMIGEAKQRMDITCDCYPYTAFGTGIGSAVFDPGWQDRFGITYGDLQWTKTGERLTQETFEKYRKEGGMVIAHAMPEEAVRAAVASKLTMIGSDGSLKSGKGHPRSAGTFARVLGKYVREEKALSLPLAIKKMTLMAAQRLEHRAPIMKRKGRLKVGGDADIVVFDPKTIVDRATYEQPGLTSVGVHHLFVNGVWTVKDGAVVEGARGGVAVRAG